MHQAPAEGMHGRLFAATQKRQRLRQRERHVFGQTARVNRYDRGHGPRARKAQRGHGRVHHGMASSSAFFAGQWPSASRTRPGTLFSHSVCAKMLALR